MNTQLTVTPQTEIGRRRRAIRKWILRITLALAVLGPLIFAIAAIGYKIGLFGLSTSFGLLNLKLGPLVLIASLVVGIISFLLAFFVQPRKGFVVAVLAILIPVLGMAKLGATKSKAAELPFIHDVTTDTQNVPVFTAAIMDKRSKIKGVNPANYVGKKDQRDKKLVSVLQTKAYPDVRSLILEDEPDVIFGKAEAIVKSMGWNIVTTDVNTGIIEATDSTFWYGFEDDVIIRIRASEGGGSVVDMRSLSRVGGSDLGKNAERIRAFTAKLKAA